MDYLHSAVGFRDSVYLDPSLIKKSSVREPALAGSRTDPFEMSSLALLPGNVARLGNRHLLLGKGYASRFGRPQHWPSRA